MWTPTQASKGGEGHSIVPTEADVGLAAKTQTAIRALWIRVIVST
jgi:hypothetical protein